MLRGVFFFRRVLVSWRRLQAPPRRAAGDPSTVVFAVLVIGWWMALASTVTMILPAPAASAPGAVYRPLPGAQARVNLPGMRSLPVPTSREAFDTARRGFAESDEDALDRAFAMAEWISVSDRNAVRIGTVEGEAIEVELLDGPWAGRRAWLRPRQLRP